MYYIPLFLFSCLLVLMLKCMSSVSVLCTLRHNSLKLCKGRFSFSLQVWLHSRHKLGCNKNRQGGAAEGYHVSNLTRPTIGH